MNHLRLTTLLAAASVAALALNPARAGDESRVIGDNESLFVDGRTFKVTPGKATGDAGPQIRQLGAREMGPGALIFRSRNRLFVVDAPLLLPGSGTDGRAAIHVAADEMRMNRIVVEYTPPKNPELQALYDRVKGQRALETLQQIFSPFRLPVDLKLKTLECGIVNAWFSRQGSERTVNLCYEYLQAIMKNVPQETTVADVTPMDALMGQFFYVVAHELGHALFDIYDVTLFGREEDAADQFAAFVMLQFDHDRARRLITGAAFSYKMYMKDFRDKPTVRRPLEAFASTHGLSEQRFYNLLCTAYGADSEQFAFLVDDEYLPKTRSHNCPREFYLLTRAFRREISPHVDRELAAKVLGTRWLEVMALR